MKIIHRITKQEAIEAYKELNKLEEEIIVEIENESGFFSAGNPGTLKLPDYPQAVPMPLYTPPNYIPPPTYC